MPTLVSVNVGLPQDVSWNGEVVHTGVWKSPAAGRVMVRRLNIDGDGQGDLGGHGGEQRAVLVYQLDAYRHWEAFLERPPMEYGSFGENFTVDGLPDDEVCVGDRFRIGEALLEVTQPRVTCYRVGIRMREPRMPSLLVAHRRPGFYCRVIEEGTVAAGDAITKESSGGGMTVADVDALLYLPDPDRDAIRRAAAMPALSPGWRGSFEAMLATRKDTRGNAGLTKVPGERPAWTGFRAVRVRETRQESPSVRSFVFEAVDGEPLPPARGGQFVVLRIDRPAPLPPLIRSYSLSDGSSPGVYRISVKRGGGDGSRFLHASVDVGHVLAISAPRGDFVLGDDVSPVVFWSAGIGITPLLGMLHDLVLRTGARPRDVFWVHGTRSGEENLFVAEIAGLLSRTGTARRLLAFSRPGPDDRAGRDYDVDGHLDVAALRRAGIPLDASFYLCGPAAFMSAARDQLQAAGVPASRIASELFGGVEALRPGIAARHDVAPHPPADESATGVSVSFVRSGLTVRWNERYPNLLALAEACDVPVRWSCRSGVCHNCETALVGGGVDYAPEPLQPAAEGNVLICCSRPRGDVQLDL